MAMELQCALCDRSFQYPAGLARHLKSKRHCLLESLQCNAGGFEVMFSGCSSCMVGCTVTWCGDTESK